MKAAIPTPAPARATADLPTFLADYGATLRSVFRDRADALRLHVQRDLPPAILREILARGPLSVFVPSEHGGRGAKAHEALAVLETSAYESLALSLTVGINGALFLQPLAKYGRDEIKGEVFERFVAHQNMGGLMMTEPDYGSDALNMETSFVRDGDGYRIEGVKHWAGLTGLADYWLVIARGRNENGLDRDVDFFVCDAHRPEQAIRVEERFENLGLFQIPYGRNRVDVRVPEAHRLEPKSTGLKMMLDMLHRSRMQFPGMGVGFLRRMFDEAVAHTRARQVGGRSLFGYDQVQRRLARLQASLTAATAMCAYAADHAGLTRDLSKEGIPANAIKTVLTDLMQEASQSLLQLVGAKGYRFDHIAGRSVVDSRPFQIFEGSNDILYEQLAAAVLKLMRRRKHDRLVPFLREYELTARAADHVAAAADVRIDDNLPQRELVDLGRALGRVITMEFVVELGERGFRSDLVDACLEQFRQEVGALLHVFRDGARTRVVEDDAPAGAWLGYVRATTG